jgi:hypothetical protein
VEESSAVDSYAGPGHVVVDDPTHEAVAACTVAGFGVHEYDHELYKFNVGPLPATMYLFANAAMAELKCRYDAAFSPPPL